MSYQLLVLDLDGTLTNSKKEITEPTRQALIEIQENGKKVVLASGRPPRGIIPLAEQLHLADYGSYILAFNGGRITDCHSGEIIYSKYLPPDTAAPLLKILGNYPDANLNILAYTDDTAYCYGIPQEYTLLETRINHLKLVEISVPEDFISITDHMPNSKFLITGDPAVISQVLKEAASHFHSYLSIYCSEPYFLEIMPQGIDKAQSLLRLLTSIGLTTDEMICCGDGYNDITMLETAGLGVAMANAQPMVLESADYITKSNDEDGVLHVINEFMRD